jgi:hypothetical protein
VWVTSNCSAQRSLLLRHGGYDESFLYAEDGELAIRLWRQGVRFRFLANAPTYEVYSKSAMDVVQKMECDQESRSSATDLSNVDRRVAERDA